MRSDTVLEMCSDIEDISFIDEDPEDEVSEGNEVPPEEVVEKANDESSNEQQQFVIKLNNEIELTSIVVTTGSRSQSAQETKTENGKDKIQPTKPSYINQVQ